MSKLYKNQTFLLILILFISAFVIFYKFPYIPKNLAFDELEFAKLALSLDNKPYTPYSPYATGHTTLYYYLILFSFKIFGVNNFALRIVSAFSGILISILFFLVAKEIFKKPYIAFLSTFLLISNRWFFNFPRFAFEAPFLFVLELTTLFFFLKALNKKSNFYSILTGVFTGLSYNSYASGRIFPFFMFFLFVFFLFKKQLSLKQLLSFAVTTFIITLPLNLYFLTHPDIRAKQLIFFFDKNITLVKKMEFLFENLKNYALMFFYKGDPNGKHNFPLKPALNPFMTILFFSGLIFSLKEKNKKENLIFFFWLIFSFLPAILTYPWENPNMLRTYTSLASIAYFSTLSFLKLFKFKKLQLILLFCLILSFVYELRTYFYFQYKYTMENAFEIRTPLEVFYKEGKLKINNQKSNFK